MQPERIADMGQWPHTFRDMMPPGGVERVVRAPTGDVGAVRLACVVLVLIRGRKAGLSIKVGERVDVTPPPVNPVECQRSIL